MARQNRKTGTKKQFSDLTPAQRTAVIGLGAVEVVLTARAGVDLARRPKSRVRGSKIAWGLALPVQPVGPIAYLLFGRR